jgi:hypothetical protein
MDRSHLSKLILSIKPCDHGMLEDPANDGKVKNTLGFKEIDIKT